MAAVSPIATDPEALLRKKLQARAGPVPQAVPDPVWGEPVAPTAPSAPAPPPITKAQGPTTAPEPGVAGLPPVSGTLDPTKPIQPQLPDQNFPAGSRYGTNATPTPTGTAQQFITNWQQTHPASEGIGPLADALKAAGFNVPRFMYGQTPSNNELVVDGQRFKVLGAEDSPQTAFWYTGQESGAATGASPSAATTPLAGASSPFQQQLRAILMQRLGQAGQPVNPNDANIAEPYAAANLEASRGQDLLRKMLAERAAATGDTSGSVTMGTQQGIERMSVGLAGLRAKLIQDEYTKRRDEIQSLLQLAAATGDAEMIRQLEAARIALNRDQTLLDDRYRYTALAAR